MDTGDAGGWRGPRALTGGQARGAVLRVAPLLATCGLNVTRAGSVIVARQSAAKVSSLGPRPG